MATVGRERTLDRCTNEEEYECLFDGSSQCETTNQHKHNRAWAQADKGTNLDLMCTYRCCEAAEFDLLTVEDVPWIGIEPLLGDSGLLVGVHQKIKGTRLGQERKERHTSRNLSDDGLDLIMNLLQRLVPLDG